jgi:hypothetical protein
MPSPPPPRLKSSHNRQPPPGATSAAPPLDSGDRLDDLLAEISILKDELGLGRWENLATWCAAGDPSGCDRPELEDLLMALYLVWADTGKGDPEWLA